MEIKLKRERNGCYFTESKNDFWRGGRSYVSVECDAYGFDEALLRREAESYLNRLASRQQMRVIRTEGPITKIPVRVERGESSRVRYLEFPIDILPF